MEPEFPPKKINILSDGNVLTFIETLKPLGSKEVFYIYKYTKSLTKKGTLLGVTAFDLNKMIRNNT